MPESAYWLDAVEASLDEAGVKVTREQLEVIAGGMQVSAEMEREVTGPPIEIGYNPVEAARKEHRREINKLNRKFDSDREERQGEWSRERSRLIDVIHDLRRELDEMRRAR